MILSEHLVRCDTDGIDFKTPWYRWTVGRLQQIFLMVSLSIYQEQKLNLKTFEKIFKLKVHIVFT